MTTEMNAVEGDGTRVVDVPGATAPAPGTEVRHRHSRRHPAHPVAPRPEGSRLLAAFRDTPPGLSVAWRWVLRVVLVVEVLLIVVVGVFSVFRFHFFTPIDEEAHFAYVQQVAEHGSLPVLGKTENSLQGLALSQGVYPRHTTINPRTDGLAGLNYEAFQPPLYYITAVPAFYVTGNYRDKVYAIRFYQYLLLLTSICLAARLARVVLRERWMIGWAMALLFFALPGVITRFTTVGDVALAVPMAVLASTELWLAWERHATARYVSAGATAALCVLSQLELVVLLPIFALVVLAEIRRRQAFRSWWSVVLVIAVPLVLLAPWLAFNEANYHMLTAGSLAIQEQMSIINPHHLHFSISQLPNDTVNSIIDPVLPIEWSTALTGQPALQYLEQMLAVLLVPASIILILGMGRRLWTIPTAILGLPYALVVIEMWYIRYGQQWMIFQRYTFPALPMLLILAAVATDTIRSRYLPVLVACGATASLLAIWGFFIFGYTGAFAFT